MRPLRALLLGVAAGAVLVYVAAFTAALAVSVGEGEVAIGIGPVLLLGVERTGRGSETTLGSGLAAVAVVCGLVNAAASWALERRAR